MSIFRYDNSHPNGNCFEATKIGQEQKTTDNDTIKGIPNFRNMFSLMNV